VSITFASEAKLLEYWRTALAIYAEELHRVPSIEEVVPWVVAFSHGLTGEQVRANVQASAEYVALHTAPVIPAPVALSAPIKANFCGHRTPWGEVCFDIFLADWNESQRQQVYAQKRALGLTHVVLAAQGGYRDQHVFDWTQQPARLAALIQDVLAAGLRPILALSSGDGGTGDHLEYLGPLLDGLGTLARECHLFPAWECVKGGWTSKQLADCLATIYRHVPDASVWFHGSDGRACGSSNPVEADDPWHGDEPGFWRANGGDKLIGLLYQTESGRVLLQADDEPLDYLGQRGWRGRATEVLMRCQDGQRGWRPIRVCCFESVAEDYFAGRANEVDVARLAREARMLGFREFGNGV
jgi:hypothetical protein